MKMTTPTPNPVLAAKLRSAREALEEAMPMLNVDARECQCCGLTVRDDFFEYGLATTLRGFIDRLERYEIPLRGKSV